MNCGYCGRPVPEDHRFCPACGAPVGQTPQSQQTLAQTSVRPVAPGGQQHVQYLSPDEAGSTPPRGPNRPMFWAGIAAAAVLVIALAVLIPILVTGRGDDSATTTTVAASTTTLAPTTTTLAATTTTLAGAAGDSKGTWAEVTVPDGPWKATEVAISEDALLIVTSISSGNKLSAIMLGSGQVVKLSQSQVISGVDIQGRVAVWWEASGWDATTQTYAHQYIRSCLLPGGTKKTIASGGPTPRMGLPQVSRSAVSWVQSTPWADDPEEYLAESIMLSDIDQSGAAVGAPRTLVPTALAFTLGDSSWQYSLSPSWVTWENGTTFESFGPGTHVIHTDGSGHQSVGEEAWRPSLWGDLLVYQDGSLKVRDLTSGDIRAIDPSGDFATAGPTFAAYYRPSDTGSFLIVRGYIGSHEQTLGNLAQPPYFCPLVSVSETHIAYAFENKVHVFAWRAQ
jgi:hypothetical protein